MSRRHRPHAVTDHWLRFSEFARWEMASGGPDPQIDMIRHMSDGLRTEERLWRALMYIAVYNVPYAEVLWRAWSHEKAAAYPEDLMKWVDYEMSQKRITTRVERRCVRRADWMQEYMRGALRLVREWPVTADAVYDAPSPEAAYEVAWTRLTAYPRIGRYVAIKLIELLRREGLLRVETPDIRPRDAWSPRHTLGELWGLESLENRDNSPEALNVANLFCRRTIDRLRDEYHVSIDMFQLQVLLCEYRESYESRRQYPGRSLDSELNYARKAEEEWQYASGMWAAREALFPAQHLGEKRGWDGPRRDVAEVLALRDYTWSDLLYDYGRTADFSAPQIWEAQA